jgi:hypothetical protein
MISKGYIHSFFFSIFTQTKKKLKNISRAGKTHPAKSTTQQRIAAPLPCSPNPSTSSLPFSLHDCSFDSPTASRSRRTSTRTKPPAAPATIYDFSRDSQLLVDIEDDHFNDEAEEVFVTDDEGAEVVEASSYFLDIKHHAHHLPNIHGSSRKPKPTRTATQPSETTNARHSSRLVNEILSIKTDSANIR